MRRNQIVFFLVLMSLTCISCGPEQNTTRTVSGLEDTLASTTTSPITEPDKPKDPDSEPIDSTPTTTSIQIVRSSTDFSIFHTNLNDPSTEMGVLCWVFWEVFRNHILLLEDPSKVSKDMTLTLTQEVYRELNKVIRVDSLTSSKLPTEVVPYANAFYAVIDERLNGRELDKPIQFDDLDGADAFFDAIEQSPECVFPSGS